MITLYRVNKTEKVIDVKNSLGVKLYSTRQKVETYTAVKFPDSIFTYQGWYTDYRKLRAYRNYGTPEEIEFKLDNTLDTIAGGLSDSDWLSVSGNVIEYIKFGKMCRFWDKIPPTKKEEIISTMNPSNAIDNVWLISYQSGGVEVYLKQLSYDKYDDITKQESLPPRKDIETYPNPYNVQVDGVIDYNYEEMAKYENYVELASPEDFETYVANESNADKVLRFDHYDASMQDPSWANNDGYTITTEQLCNVRCIEINLYANAFTDEGDENSEFYRRVEIGIRDYKPGTKTDERFAANVENVIYTKVTCMEDMTIPTTNQHDYLMLEFAFQTSGEWKESGTYASYDIPLTVKSGEFKAGDTIYSVISGKYKASGYLTDIRIRELKIETE